jgi:tRNA threonylcarbamoyladenosine biosynthesis protein TsaB
LKILAVEMSSDRGSVAMMSGSEIDETIIEDPREQTRTVLAIIDRLLARAAVGLRDLDAIAFGRGPGSFTGIRIAVTVAQGLALASGRSLVTVSSLAALAQRAYRVERATRSLVCIDARMGEVYWGVFAIESGLATPLGDERIDRPDDVVGKDASRAFGVGNGFAAYPEALARTHYPEAKMRDRWVPLARDLLPFAVSDLRAGRLIAPEAARPVYLRRQSAWKQKGSKVAE